MEKLLGRIRVIDFVDIDGRMGFSFELGGESWGVMDFLGFSSADYQEYYKWEETDRLIALGSHCMFIRNLLRKAKKTKLKELQNTPIEATFNDGVLKSWRILTEVL